MIRWEEFQQRRASEAEVKHWFSRWPDANVGILAGSLSGLVVLDVDPRHGGDQSLKVLQQSHGPFPPTIEARTGGGGRHLYFAHPAGVVHNRVAIAPGIDLRGDGGLVVAPSSVHRSGRRYVWVWGPTLALAALPKWLLLEMATSLEHPGHPLSYWRQLLREGVAEGERNNTIASITGHLLWHGIDPQVVTELMLCWNAIRCRPPLADEEVIGVVESITRMHRRSEEASAAARPD